MGPGCVQQSSEGLIIAALLPLFFMQTNSHDSSNLSTCRQESSSLVVHSEPVFDFSPANIPV